MYHLLHLSTEFFFFKSYRGKSLQHREKKSVTFTMSDFIAKECSVKNLCTNLSVLSGALWHVHQICYLTYQKKSQYGQIKSGQLKTEEQWHCVLRHTLWSLLLGCRPSHNHYKGKSTAQNASQSWVPSAGLWVM